MPAKMRLWRYLQSVLFACCDESGIHREARWWVIGTIWLPENDRLAQYEADATTLRQKANCWGEFKWEKVSAAYLDPYADFLQLTLKLPKVRFASIVVDTNLFNPEEMKRFHGDGGRQVAYLKFMRMLLKERIRRLVEDGHRDYVLLYDKLSVSRPDASNFRSILKGDIERIAVAQGVSCKFDRLSQMNSAGLHLMQAADLLTGATWSAWEKADGSGKKAEARKALRGLIETWAGGVLTNTTFNSRRYYSLWLWEPSK